jgi:ligand-binding sensor domain-containing protein
LFRLGDRDGRVAAFLPPGQDSARWISTVTEDGPSALWVGTHAGPFRFHPATGRFERVELPGTITRPYINAVLRDRSSELWVASTAGLYRLGTAGIEHYSTENGFPSNTVNPLAQDSIGRVWAGTEQGLCRITSSPAGGRIVDRVYTVDDGLPANSVRALLHRTDGSLWIGTQKGLAEIPGSGTAPHGLTLGANLGPRFRRYSLSGRGPESQSLDRHQLRRRG